MSRLGNSPKSLRRKDVSESGDAVLASCLALSVQDQADLAVVTAAWPMLPAAVRAGIVAMVRVSAAGGGTEAGK